jgi:Flp pilus assembly protein TadB
MAQTKRKRRTKHRGNAAGVVETRGRTGRRPTAGERKATGKAAKPNRYDQPPTWRGALNRSVLILIPFALIIALVTKQVATLFVLVPFMLVLYVPLGYYTDLWMYRRRERQKAEGKL